MTENNTGIKSFAIAIPGLNKADFFQVGFCCAGELNAMYEVGRKVLTHPRYIHATADVHGFTNLSKEKRKDLSHIVGAVLTALNAEDSAHCVAISTLLRQYIYGHCFWVEGVSFGGFWKAKIHLCPDAPDDSAMEYLRDEPILGRIQRTVFPQSIDIHQQISAIEYYH